MTKPIWDTERPIDSPHSGRIMLRDARRSMRATSAPPTAYMPGTGRVMSSRMVAQEVPRPAGTAGAARGAADAPEVRGAPGRNSVTMTRAAPMKAAKSMNVAPMESASVTAPPTAGPTKAPMRMDPPTLDSARPRRSGGMLARTWLCRPRMKSADMPPISRMHSAATTSTGTVESTTPTPTKTEAASDMIRRDPIRSSSRPPGRSTSSVPPPRSAMITPTTPTAAPIAAR